MAKRNVVNPELTKLTRLLEEIRDSDVQQVEAQFHIANVLTAIRDHELYLSDGYYNFQQMVTAELDFPYSAANRYVSLHTSYTRLRYNKEEFLKLMQNFGWRKLEQALGQSDKKMGKRAIKSYLDSLDTRDNQFNFNVYDKPTATKFEATLAQFGMEFSPGGSRVHLTDALLGLLDDYHRLKAREAYLPTKAPTKTKKAKAQPAEQLELDTSS